MLLFYSVLKYEFVETVNVFVDKTLRDSCRRKLCFYLPYVSMQNIRGCQGCWKYYVYWAGLFSIAVHVVGVSWRGVHIQEEEERPVEVKR